MTCGLEMDYERAHALRESACDTCKEEGGQTSRDTSIPAACMLSMMGMYCRAKVGNLSSMYSSLHTEECIYMPMDPFGKTNARRTKH